MLDLPRERFSRPRDAQPKIRHQASASHHAVPAADAQHLAGDPAAVRRSGQDDPRRDIGGPTTGVTSDPFWCASLTRYDALS